MRPGSDKHAPSGEWLRDEVRGHGEIPVPVLGTSITLDEIYEDIELPPLAVGEGEDEEAWEEWEVREDGESSASS